MRKLFALLLSLSLLSGCTAPMPPEETTAVTEDVTDPLEGPLGLPTPAL